MLTFTLHLLCHIYLSVIVCHLAVLGDLSPYFIIIGLTPPPQTPKLSPLFNSSIPTLQSPVHSFSLFHRFNRMHLGHTSILCNLYHLCAKLRQSERLMARQTNTNIHTRCT